MKGFVSLIISICLRYLISHCVVILFWQLSVEIYNQTAYHSYPSLIGLNQPMVGNDTKQTCGVTRHTQKRNCAMRFVHIFEVKTILLVKKGRWETSLQTIFSRRNPIQKHEVRSINIHTPTYAHKHTHKRPNIWRATQSQQ